MPLTLRLDPWTPAYESAVQVDEDEDGLPAQVDTGVETADWRPMEPQFVNRPGTIAFIDGVQRVETRIIGQNNDKTVYGAFASVAVGATVMHGNRCGVEARPPRRLLALSDGESHPTVSVPCGNLTLDFEPESTHVSGLAASQQVVQNARRTAEVALGEELDERGYDMVVVDGRLNWQPKRKTMVIGLVKTIHKRYLEGAKAGVIGQLAPNVRTPLFRIGRDQAVYSWYVRLAPNRPIDHPWAGVVRVETLESIGIEAAVRLADLTTCHLPHFASSPVHDPRAPQNLTPIGGLEDQLRHSLGDREWIRRHIETYFLKELGTAG
jgi:hypothetical protein